MPRPTIHDGLLAAADNNGAQPPTKRSVAFCEPRAVIVGLLILLSATAVAALFTAHPLAASVFIAVALLLVGASVLGYRRSNDSIISLAAPLATPDIDSITLEMRTSQVSGYSESLRTSWFYGAGEPGILRCDALIAVTTSPTTSQQAIYKSSYGAVAPARSLA